MELVLLVGQNAIDYGDFIGEQYAASFLANGRRLDQARRDIRNGHIAEKVVMEYFLGQGFSLTAPDNSGMSKPDPGYDFCLSSGTVSECLCRSCFDIKCMVCYGKYLTVTKHVYMPEFYVWTKLCETEWEGTLLTIKGIVTREQVCNEKGYYRKGEWIPALKTKANRDLWIYNGSAMPITTFVNWIPC